MRRVFPMCCYYNETILLFCGNETVIWCKFKEISPDFQSPWSRQTPKVPFQEKSGVLESVSFWKSTEKLKTLKWQVIGKICFRKAGMRGPFFFQWQRQYKFTWKFVSYQPTACMTCCVLKYQRFEENKIGQELSHRELDFSRQHAKQCCQLTWQIRS